MRSLYTWLGCIFRLIIEYLLNAFGFFTGIIPFCFSKIAESGRLKRRIAFQVHSLHLAQFYQTITDRLLEESDKIEVVIVILPHPQNSFFATLKMKKEISKRLKITTEKIKFYWQVIWEKFDMVLYLDVYAKFQMLYSSNCILKHGPGLNYRHLHKKFFRKTLSDFDLVLVNGSHDYNLLKKYYQKKSTAPRLITVGFPYLDRIFNHALSKSEKKDFPQKKIATVLLGPSWRGLNECQKNQVDYLEEILNALAGLDIKITIKLHACSFSKGMSFGTNWDEKIKSLLDTASFTIDKDIDDIPSMMKADLLITDVSSRAFNFMLLDKPVILYSPVPIDMDKWGQTRMQLMLEGAFVAKKPKDVKEIITQIDTGTAPARSRIDVAKRSLSNAGTATDAVVKIIKDELYGKNRNSLQSEH